MPRPSLLTVGVVLLVGMFGLMAVASVQRARTARAASAPAETTAAAPEQVAVETQTETVTEAEPAPFVETETPAPEIEPLRAPERAALPPKPVVKPEPKPQPPPTFDIARVRPGRTVALRSSPGGRVLTSVGATTEFGSRTTLAVAKRRGGWLGVTSTALPNGAIGWVKRSPRELQTGHSTRLSIRIDLSERRLELRKGKRLVRKATVGIGRPGSPTPTGRFAVTDKLQNTYGPFYGCCIVALSGHQPHTPPGWTGGNRLAIHGTDNPASIGVPSSAGCLHAEAEDLKVLMRRVPLGTPVFISR